VCAYDFFERALDGNEAICDGRAFVRVDDAVATMGETGAAPLDDAPSEMARPGVDAEDDHVP
jgi:hypothetical protein